MTLNVCRKCLNSRVPVWMPLIINMQARSMKSVNTRTPRPMHITRAKLMRVTEYQKPKDTRPMAEQCTLKRKQEKAVVEEEPNLVQTFMANQCRAQLLSCSLIAVFHNEGLSTEEVALMRRRLQKANISLKVFGNRIVKEAVQNTPLVNMEPLLVGSNLYALCDKPVVKELLNATKKIPKIHLLGGLVENRLMSSRQMTEFSQLPAKAILQGELAGILSQSVGSTYSLLQRNQQALVTNLSQWIKQCEETSV